MELDLAKVVAKKKLLISFICLGLLAIILVGLYFLFTTKNKQGLIVFFMITISALWLTGLLIYNHHLNVYFKEQILKETFEFYHFDYFNRVGGIKKKSNPFNIDDDEFYDADFVNKKSGNNYVAGDLLVGKLDSINFRSVDINCNYVVNTGKSTTVVTLFKGRVYSLDLQAPNDFKLVIREESDFLNKINSSLMHEIELESINFNKKFNIYTNDDQKAFYYLTPLFMEKIEALEKTFEGKLLISINKGNLYIARNDNKDNFEIPKSEKWDDFKKQITDEIDFIHGCNTLVKKPIEN